MYCRTSDRIILVKLIVGQRVVTCLSLYAPQSGLSDKVKDLYFDQLCAVTASSEFLIPCGDWNGHVGRAGIEYREVHGWMGYGSSEPDVEDERTLGCALAFDLLLENMSRNVTAISSHTSQGKCSQADRLHPFP